MPKARPKEGSNMRLDSIYALNSNEQNNHNPKANAAATAGKTTSGAIFEDILKAHIQQASKPAITQNAENQIAGLLLGYITPLRVTYKSEPELEISAS